MKNLTLLVVEDDENILELLQDRLSKEGWHVLFAKTYSHGAELLKEQEIDILISDWMLPDGAGVDYLLLKKELHYSPLVILLTARSDEQSVVSALELGVDEYIVKPFFIKELITRIHRLQKRHFTKPKDKITCLSLALDCNLNKVTYLGKVSTFIPVSEARILKILMEAYPNPVSRKELAQQLWGSSEEECNINVYVARLRASLAKLSDRTSYIQTIRHKGYVISEDLNKDI